MSSVDGGRSIRTTLLCALGIGAVSCKLLERIFEEPPPLPAKHPTRDLVIERGVASFNGKRIAPGVPLSRWVELLGEPDRVKGRYHLWDRLGLGAASIDQASNEVRPKLIVDCLVVVFRPPEVFTSGVFSGRVLMEGAPLYDGAKISFINRQFKPTCENAVAGFVEAMPPGSYVCRTAEPRVSYELRVDVYDNDAWVRWLNF